MKNLQKYHSLLFATGIILILVPTILKTYLLMPFPGSQGYDLTGLAFFFWKWSAVFIVLGIILISGSTLRIFRSGKWWKRIMLALLLIICGAVVYLTQFFISPEKMFREPKQIVFKTSAENKVLLDAIIIGTFDGTTAKAFPVDYLAYHHKIQDTLGKIPILPTYCSLCRSARVFSPLVDGKYFTFKLVGVQHNNAVITDAETGSWWFQETGEAVMGSMKGKTLAEISSEQMSLKTWLEKYPESLIFQPDPANEKKYDIGFANSGMNYRDEEFSGNGWNPLAKVIGIAVKNESKAYLWSFVQNEKIINDRIGIIPVLIALENDSASFHVFNRVASGKTLDFTIDPSGNYLSDIQTNSKWNRKGECLEGELKGTKLSLLQSYQEYWDSWKTFHPLTKQYIK